MPVPLSVRKGWVAALPWVRRLKKPEPCDGIKYGMVGMKALRERNIPDKAKCKKTAEWHYKSLPNTPGYSTVGNYCWSHVVGKIDNEYDRYLRYTARYPEKFPEMNFEEES